MDEFRAFKVKEENKDRLLDRPNIIGTGVGQKTIDGQKQTAIIVFVEEKMDIDTVISKYSAEDLIPDDIDGIPTKIIEVGQITKQGYQQRIRPIKPGFSAGHASITAGTIGGFFRDKDNDIVALSNNHVFAWENKAQLNDLIYQPGPLDSPAASIKFSNWDQPVSNLPYFATLKKFMSLNRSNNLHDSAIAKIHQSYVDSNLLDYNYPQLERPLSGINTASINMEVQKCGRTTGHTKGSVIALHSTFTISYDFGPARFNDCIVLSGMSAGGDSGSIILDNDMNAIGLLFAGSGKVTLANPIQYVIAEYGLSIINSNVRTQAVEHHSGWMLHSTNGVIIGTPDTMEVNANSNSSCYVERQIDKLNSIRIVVNSKTDDDGEYGPGLAIMFEDDFLKINLGAEGMVGRTKSRHVTQTGYKSQPNTEYMLRVKHKDNCWVGDVFNGTAWVEVIRAEITSKPKSIRVGKMDEFASIGLSNQGKQVQSYFSDALIN